MNHLSKLNQRFLIVPKLLYFFLAVAFYVFHQFRSQFIVDRYNMEKDKLGLLMGIPQTLSFFTSIWIGSMNDRSGKQKMILVSLLMLSSVFFQAFFMSNDLLLFWINFSFYFCLLSATIPLLDKVMMDYVSDIPEMGPKSLGSQRVWSTFGYLATNYAVEHIITTKGQKEYDYSNMKYFNFFAVSIAGVLLYLFVKNLPRRATGDDYSSSLKALLNNFDYLYFIFIILLCGISRAFMTNYLGFYYSKVLMFNDQKNTLNLFWPLSLIADKAFEHKQSTSTFFGVALEIIIFFNSSRITDRMGLFWPILLSQVFQTFRFLSYCFLSHQNPNSFTVCCLIELLKGANYALIHTSALQLANSFCPPYLRTTSQLFYNGVFVALSTVISGFSFMPFFSKGSDDVEKCYSEFQQAFKWNTILSIAGIVFFVYRYGLRENLLFSRANAERKMKQIERNARREENNHEKALEKENLVEKKEALPAASG